MAVVILMSDVCCLHAQCFQKLKKLIKTEDDGDVCSNHCSISNDVQSDDEVVIVDKSSLIMWCPTW